jgi:hypothetical protein
MRMLVLAIAASAAVCGAQVDADADGAADGILNPATVEVREAIPAPTIVETVAPPSRGAAPDGAASEDDEVLEKAEAAYRSENVALALTLYQQVVARDPSNAHAQARVSELQASAAASAEGDEVPGGGLLAAVVPASGSVSPTAAGRSGSTQVTAAMPLDAASLAAMRQKYVTQPEFRACVDHAQRLGSADPEQVRNKIIQLMDRAKAINLNTVFFQVRGEASTLYPSQYEPWSRVLGGKSPGFDPVEFAIDEAHKRGIQFHAYYNISTCSDERVGPARPEAHLVSALHSGVQPQLACLPGRPGGAVRGVLVVQYQPPRSADVHPHDHCRLRLALRDRRPALRPHPLPERRYRMTRGARRDSQARPTRRSWITPSGSAKT